MSRVRESFLAGARDIAPLVPAAISFGLVTGAAVTQAGLGLLESVGMSVGVYGGAAQLAATVLWDERAPLAVTAGTALVINARFFIDSASIAPLLSARSVAAGSALAYLLRDGADALTMTRAVGSERIATGPYYVGAGLTDWGMWVAATSAGALGAAFVPESWSLEFVVTLVFIALLMDAVKGRPDIEAAIVAATAAVVLVPLLPLQTGLLAAIALGMTWGFVRDVDSGGGGAP